MNVYERVLVRTFVLSFPPPPPAVPESATTTHPSLRASNQFEEK